MTRKEAIEAIKNNYPDRKYSILREALDMAIEALQAEPVKHGEWQIIDKSLVGVELWVCSVCGSPLMTDDISENHYCPNCGAKMDTETRSQTVRYWQGQSVS